LLLYRNFNEKKRELMFKKAREVYDIALEEYDIDPSSNQQPEPFPFSSMEEMGQILDAELERLKMNAIWTARAENFNPKLQKEELTAIFQDLLSPFTAGSDLMKGTMLFTITVRLPKKPNLEGSRF